jgi:predicted secreted protein
VQHSSYFLWHTPPSSTFIEFFISFYSSLFQVFGRLLGPWSFNNLKRSLACKQNSLPITFGGVKVISTSTIISTAYFGKWALVTSIIVVRIMVDQCLFLLEALTVTTLVLGLRPRQGAWKGESWKCNLGVTFTFLGMQKNVKEWIDTLPSGSHFGS